MKAARILPPLLAGATLILLGANVVPASHKKQRLRQEIVRLQDRLRAENAMAERLRAEIEALRSDPFYLERTLLETWKSKPEGAVPFDPYARPDDEHGPLD